MNDSTSDRAGTATSSSPSPRLRVDADLSVVVDGTTARLTGDGDRLVLFSSHPERVWAAAVGAALPSGVGDLNGPRAVGRLADGLAAAGLQLEVTGPRGQVVRLGDGVRSRVGGVVTGSTSVGPGAPAAMAVAAVGAGRRLTRVVGVALVAGAVAVLANRRRLPKGT